MLVLKVSLLLYTWFLLLYTWLLLLSTWLLLLSPMLLSILSFIDKDSGGFFDPLKDNNEDIDRDRDGVRKESKELTSFDLENDKTFNELLLFGLDTTLLLLSLLNLNTLASLDC